ncbi:MAG: adenylate/guanylate cyclase domain-containing protein, partial [Chloroflexota bacterium]|nr:adenylate/guanylate cyclase domain-containing protein [Chloroflexota bacterium]
MMQADIHSPLAALENQLRRYLPEQRADALLAQSSLVTARPCATHLDALLRAVSTYLPRYLVEEQLRDPQPGRVSGQFREATIMFADISGFTAMSERLSRRGEEGAEKITNIVGDYFTAMLDITASQGGDLLKFGGDALLVAFFGDEHAINGCRAGAQMQQAIARFRQVEAFGETFSLKMTVGLGSGLLFTANLGTTEKMEYTAMGQALARMAHAEDQAEGGEIFIDEATYQVVKARVDVGETRDGCYLITHVEGSESPGGQSSTLETAPQLRGDDLPALVAHIKETVACLDALVPFLPPGLLDILRFDPARMAAREKGEFRPVTIIFANFYGIEEIISRLGPEKVAETTAILNTHFSTMHEIIHRYGGVVDKVDSYVVGHRIMALFGAPRAHVDDPERAVRAAWEMQAAMSAFDELETSAGTFALKQRIGINSGRVFAGNVGSDARHEYSVMGDEVNLTARLMSAAQEGQVLISQSTAAQVGKRFQLDEKEPVRVKGKSLAIPNYAVQGIVERYQVERAARRSPLVGRDEEWQAIWRVARRALKGDYQVLDIHGEMGLGKSRVVEELIDHWESRGGDTLFAGCPSYGRHTPYAPWVIILRQLFGLRDDDSDQERREKVASRLVAANPEWADWAALIAHLLGVPMPESSLLKSLDPKLRQQNLQRIVVSLIASEAEGKPTLLVVDDIQWIDEPSLALLNHLTTHVKSRPLLVCVTYRPEEPPDLAASKQPNHTAVSLEALSEADSLALLDSQLPTTPEMPRQLKELILKNAQGIPLFIVEMAHALIESYLSYDAESGLYHARADLERVQVPDTVSRVILSRLDRLDEQSRNMLKVASVIGREFQRWLLQSVYPYRADEEEMETRLLAMCQKELLDRIQVAYLFRHVMTREVAYESLLYAERRDLHRKIAQSIETQRSARVDEQVEILAEHYTLAEDWPQALEYHLKAGDRAQAIYANEDAVHRYKKALEIVQ